jgi:hypothetical protein
MTEAEQEIFDQADVAMLADAWRVARFGSKESESAREEAIKQILSELPDMLTEIHGLRHRLQMERAKRVHDAMEGSVPCPWCGGTGKTPNAWQTANAPWNGQLVSPPLGNGTVTTTGGTTGAGGGGTGLCGSGSITFIK